MDWTPPEILFFSVSWKFHPETQLSELHSRRRQTAETANFCFPPSSSFSANQPALPIFHTITDQFFAISNIFKLQKKTHFLLPLSWLQLSAGPFFILFRQICKLKLANIQIIVQPQARKLSYCTNLLQYAEVTQGKISWKRSQEANILSFRSWLLNPMNPFDPPASRQLPLNCRTCPSIQDSRSSKGLAMLWRNIEKCPFASIQFSGKLKVSPV